MKILILLIFKLSFSHKTKRFVCYILYRNRPNDIQPGLQGPRGLQKSLQDYFTARFYFLILRVRFKIVFCSDKCRLLVILFTVLSAGNKLVGCPLGVHISYK